MKRSLPSFPPLPPVLLLAALLLLLPLLACGGDGASADGGAPAAAGNFRLASVDGSELGPPDYAGQVVLVDFWATWCVPCHAQGEVLKKLYPKLTDSVVFLAVDVGEDESQVRGYLAESPYPYPVLLDPEAKLSDSLGINGLPTLLILDADGQVRYFDAGLLSEREVCKELERAGSGKSC